MDTKEKYREYVNTSFMAAVEPLVIESAKGATIYDEDGKPYLDCFSGISVTNAGHGNDKVMSAAKRQMEKLIHCCSYVYHVKPVADLAEKLASITPGRLKKSFFGNSGAEAIESAIRLVKRFTNKTEMIALTHSFHGRSLATLSITGNSGRKKGGGPYLPGVAFAPAPYCFRCPFKKDEDSCDLSCALYVEDVIRFQTSENIAFFIAEPILGEGGIIVPPSGYFTMVKEILDHHGIPFIADEVQSGFGRTGKMFAVEHYNSEPDIMVMAKGIADGFPLSCCITRDEIADSFQPGDHLSTFGGNPVSCAASLANITFMENNSISNKVVEKGRLLMEAVNEINPKHVIVGEIRGKGLMIGLEIVKDAKTKIPATEEAAKIRTALREHGVLIGVGGYYGNVLRIQPPLTVKQDELMSFADTLKKILEE